MEIDTAQPWGIALDYAGRATVVERGHSIDVRVYDTTFGAPLEPDPATGDYPVVYVTAQFNEAGALGSVPRGFGQVILTPAGGRPVGPDREAVRSAVAAALVDFDDRVAAYLALCTCWTAGGPAPGDDHAEEGG
ncbi:ATP-binding protein [Peterkaempfera bronchialis]|uniref:ATP-binding protein n=1 Tax=Peterkaempfera bronchialis TaxID=2126346 RepID=A0A345SWG0_9ACTN|nr:ATP-binding protein [Peterkaempfera bronchialis]AXI78065.1 ATP-binding protein [Peterkaempfera bronchialis]